MSVVGKLIGFGLRQAIGAVAGDGAGEAANSVIQLVEQHFTDHSQSLSEALARANDRTWRALSIALARDTLLDQIKRFFLASGDDKGIREQVRLFLLDKNIGYEDMPVDFRKKCLAELSQAKKAGLLSYQNLSLNDVARQTANFHRYANLKDLVDGAEQVMGQIANDLGAEFPNLGELLQKPTPGAGPPLLVVAFSYFFRREVETNAELNRGLVFTGLRQLSASQERAFDELNEAVDELNEKLTSQGESLDKVLEQLGSVDERLGEIATIGVKTLNVGAKTHGAVVDLQGQVIRQGEQIQISQEKTHDVLFGVKSDVSDMKAELHHLKHWMRKEGYVHRARVNLDNGKIDRAIAYATEAIRLGPGDGDAYRIRAEAYRIKAEHGEYDDTIEHDVKQAIADANDAIRIDHQDAHAYRIRANTFITQMRWDIYENLCDRAIADATEAISLAPHDAENYCIRAEAYFWKDEDDQAIASAEEAIRIDPTSDKAHEILVDAYSERADAYKSKNEFDLAIADYTAVIRLGPKSTDTYLGRADAYKSKNEFDLAIADYTAVIRLDPKSVDAYLERAITHLRKGSFDQAIDDATKVIQLNPKYAWAYAIRANAHLYKSNYDQVITDATEAIRLDPESARAYYTRANAHVRMGNIDQAKDDNIKGLLRQKTSNPQLTQLFNETMQAIEAAKPPAPAAVLPAPSGKTVPVSGYSFIAPGADELFVRLKRLGAVWHSKRKVWEVPAAKVQEALALSPQLQVLSAEPEADNKEPRETASKAVCAGPGTANPFSTEQRQNKDGVVGDGVISVGYMMTEQEWLDCADPKVMLAFVERRASQRKLRLFAVACCRRVWNLLADSRSREAVIVAEKYADQLVTDRELKKVHRIVRAVARGAGSLKYFDNWQAAEAASDALLPDATKAAAEQMKRYGAFRSL